MSVTSRITGNPTIFQRTPDILRLLARVEFVPRRWIHPLVGHGMNPESVRLWLNELHARRLIWKAPAEATRVPDALGATNANAPPRAPMLYGLTAQGRTWLLMEGYEDDPAVLDRAIVRDWKRPEIKTGQLAHDLLVVEWCCRALDALMQTGRLRSVACALEYISATTSTGQPLQRIDALLAIQIAPPRQQDAQERPLPILPWGWPDPREPGCVAWALEIDRGTEPLATLLGKGVMYRDLTVSGHYTATLQMPLLPVIVTLTGRRAAQIAREWLDAWPGGRGVIAARPWLAPALGGVLGGGYKTLGTNPARPATLWTDLGDLMLQEGKERA